MEYLGGLNLFTSHFVMGCKESLREYTQTETTEIESLHRWMNFKDNDCGMERYKTSRTQYICYFHIIPIDTLNDILNDLYCIYIKHYPYSVKADFIKHVLGTTIHEIKEVIEWDRGDYFTWLSNPPNETIYSYYYIFGNDKEFYDFGILDLYDINYYLQYFNRVLDLIENFTVKPKSKSFTNDLDLLSNEQKRVVDLFIKKGFKDSHIYRFLKDEKYFINITEIEYVKFMNKEYNKGWKHGKRITTKKDITFKVEMFDFYNENVPKTT